MQAQLPQPRTAVAGIGHRFPIRPQQHQPPDLLDQNRSGTEAMDNANAVVG